MTISEYTIIADRLADATKKIEKLNKRARKLGVPEVTLQVVPGSEQIKKDGNDNYMTIDVILVGEKIKLAGWHFAATIQHTGEGNIVRRVPGSDEGSCDLKAYRNVDPMCDHCKQLRRRNDTYIVVNDEGETKQVGSSCLRDFLGMDPASALWMAQFLIDLDAEFEAEYGEPGERTIPFFNTVSYLGWVNASIRNSGWLSRGKARWEEGAIATADDAFNVWDWRGKGPRPYTSEDTDVELAEKALEWIRNYEDVESANDYIYNLYVASKQNYITYREFGLVASLIPAYTRHIEQEIARRREAKDSQWVSEVGKREVFTLTVEGIRYQEGRFGPTFITKLVDEDGNIFTWFASLELKQGETYTGKATVKDHTEFRGVKQTVINRPKFELVEA